MSVQISIGIVTFEQRFDLVKKLIDQIRSKVPDSVDIILAVNANNEENLPNDYRESILELCLKQKNVFPIMCPEFKSLAKLWNTIVIFSKTEYVFLICDDVIYENENTLETIKTYIESSKDEFFTINNQFSHFVITKNMLHNLGYFDERLIAFGEEDGDMVHRYIEAFGKRMRDIHIPGIYNLAAYDLKSENLEIHSDNKPRFNREFANLKYKEDALGIKGMAPFPVVKVIPDYQQYPYETFVKNNKHNISNFQKVILDE